VLRESEKRILIVACSRIGVMLREFEGRIFSNIMLGATRREDETRMKYSMLLTNVAERVL